MLCCNCGPRTGAAIPRSDLLGNARNIAFWVVLFLLILVLFNLFSNGTGSSPWNGGGVASHNPDSV